MDFLRGVGSLIFMLWRLVKGCFAFISEALGFLNKELDEVNLRLQIRNLEFKIEHPEIDREVAPDLRKTELLKKYQELQGVAGVREKNEVERKKQKLLSVQRAGNLAALEHKIPE